ncbi:MAG TPA: hypothetical protein VNJ70_18740 [Thermoanaerobaculia bacterium]|nr:hypothetical protein [Thermoanaerobaculia bacterium]
MLDAIGTKLYEKLGQAGKATLIFTVAKYPGDQRFDGDPPHVDLYIVPMAHNSGEASSRAGEDNTINSGGSPIPSSDQTYAVSDMHFLGTISPEMEGNDRSFIVVVESLHGLFSRFFKRKPRRESLEVLVVAEPHGPWKQFYERTAYKKKLKSGRPIPLTVHLKPKPNYASEQGAS